MCVTPGPGLSSLGLIHAQSKLEGMSGWEFFVIFMYIGTRTTMLWKWKSGPIEVGTPICMLVAQQAEAGQRYSAESVEEQRKSHP